jgi:hypothetical protein
VQIAELRELELLEQFQDVFAWVYIKASWDDTPLRSMQYRDMQQHNSLIAGCEIFFPCDFVMDLEYFSYYILFAKIRNISEFRS